MKIFKGITKYIIILILFSLLISYCNLQIAMYIRYAIDGILFHNLEEIPKFIQPIIEMDIIRSLIILSGIIMGIRGILVFVNYIRERITTKFTLKISANLKEALYAHILKVYQNIYFNWLPNSEYTKILEYPQLEIYYPNYSEICIAVQ